MTQYIFRKISSILLLLLVIIINITFSILIHARIPDANSNAAFAEGLTTIQNPQIEDLNKLSDIVDGKIPTTTITYKVSEKMKQIILMRDDAVKYTALNDIYNSNTKAYYSNLVNEIETPIEKNANGIPFDANAMPTKNREIARAIITSGKISEFYKLCKLLELTGTDRKMTNISEKYENTWISLIRDYVVLMKQRVITIKDFTSCSQFTNCTTCTNGKINNSIAQCYWNNSSNTCENTATYGTSTTCPITNE